MSTSLGATPAETVGNPIIAPFQAPQIKIDRAKLHIEELAREIESYFRREAAQIIWEYAEEFRSVDGEICAFTYRENEPVPLSWSAIIGDIVHNLRASLDLLACDIHRITGGKPEDTDHVHYPFCKCESELPEMMRRRRLGSIGHDFADTIKQTAPYKDGNVGLRAIHDLDLMDKHQALIPTVGVVSLPWPVPIREGPQQFITAILRNRQRIILMPRAFCALPLGSVIRAEFQILFGVDTPFPAVPILRQLNECVAGFQRILALFQSVASKRPALSSIGASQS